VDRRHRRQEAYRQSVKLGLRRGGKRRDGPTRPASAPAWLKVKCPNRRVRGRWRWPGRRRAPPPSAPSSWATTTTAFSTRERRLRLRPGGLENLEDEGLARKPFAEDRQAGQARLGAPIVAESSSPMDARGRLRRPSSSACERSSPADQRRPVAVGQRSCARP
jgi:hypothetical protein